MNITFLRGMLEDEEKNSKLEILLAQLPANFLEGEGNVTAYLSNRGSEEVVEFERFSPEDSIDRVNLPREHKIIRSSEPQYHLEFRYKNNLYKVYF